MDSAHDQTYSSPNPGMRFVLRSSPFKKQQYSQQGMVGNTGEREDRQQLGFEDEEVDYGYDRGQSQRRPTQQGRASTPQFTYEPSGDHDLLSDTNSVSLKLFNEKLSKYENEIYSIERDQYVKPNSGNGQSMAGASKSYLGGNKSQVSQYKPLQSIMKQSPTGFGEPMSQYQYSTSGGNQYSDQGTGDNTSPDSIRKNKENQIISNLNSVIKSIRKEIDELATTKQWILFNRMDCDISKLEQQIHSKRIQIESLEETKRLVLQF